MLLTNSYKVTQRNLLVILPKQYDELCLYPMSMVEFDKPALLSLSEYWLPPFEASTSPYGVDVFKKIQAYSNTCDKNLLDKCLKEICTRTAVILKRQRGDAYGFGDTVDSLDMIIKNLSEEMLDDPDATSSKKIENYLGNLDRYLTSTGPQGFDKITDDLILKYGKDLILKSDMAWTSRENRDAARDLKFMQSDFNKKQEMLKCHGIEDAEKELGFEPYITCIKNVNHRKALSKFRLSNHQLMIEVGRHKKIPKLQRFCPFCPSPVIEDEIHFLINCPLYDPLRRDIYDICLELKPTLPFYTDEQTFLFMMTSTNLYRVLAKFIHEAMNMRKELLSNTI